MNIEEYSKIGFQFYNEEVSPLLKKYLHETAWQNYLDCGCGDGALLYRLNLDNIFENKNVIAVDLSENRINLVKKINSKIDAHVDDV